VKSKIIKNSILIIFFSLLLFWPIKKIFAESVTTSVIVGNSAPGFTIAPSETVASTTTSPTNVGSTVTFTATGTDGNGDNYYLAICKTDAISANSQAVPTCTGGNWCISTSTTSASEASCGYGTVNGAAESNAWFAFVCDYSTASTCSVSSQGAGDSGSPFEVNHAPSFTAIGNTSPLNPGSTQTWTTSVGTSDVDTDDTVKLVICKTTGISGSTCDGGASDTWCSSNLGDSSPNCNIGISIPTADTSYNAYAYVFDMHSFAASGANQGVGASYVVNNVAPVISAISVNGGSSITLNEGDTAPVVLGATITDNNGCTDLSTVTSDIYRSGVGNSNCDVGGDANNNNCYPALSCSVAGGNACDGATDPSASYQCTTNLKNYADPTDSNTTYDGQTWKDTFHAIDNNSASDTLEIGTGVVLNSLLAMDIGSSLAYGNVSTGQTVDPLSKLTVITATGNVGLDQELSGTNMDDGSTHTIAVGYQKYALSASTAYAVGTTLTTSATEAELNCTKTTSDIGSTKPTFWGISIPQGTFAGTYSGTNTITAVKGEYAQW
jgi:hypothetical protein